MRNNPSILTSTDLKPMREDKKIPVCGMLGTIVVSTRGRACTFMLTLKAWLVATALAISSLYKASKHTEYKAAAHKKDLPAKTKTLEYLLFIYEA